MTRHGWGTRRSFFALSLARIRGGARMARLPLALLLILSSLASLGIGVSAAPVPSIQFNLTPAAKFLACLKAPTGTPTAAVKVTRGTANDTLEIVLDNYKPNTVFELFTIQRSNLQANGTPVANFAGFGLSWYQSEINTDGSGHADVTIRTILLDQIFGFAPDAPLPPTNTFHVGIWFNDPSDAAPCGFDINKPTPFNGSQNAGPNAAISLPNATSGLGPLSTIGASSTSTPAAAAPASTAVKAADAPVQFNLTPAAKFLACLNQPTGTPTAAVTVTHGAVNDTLEIVLDHFKPNLAFDLFTTQRSPLQANGTPVTGFTNFGLAWYQSDIQTDSNGHADVTIQTILLNEIFGFDPDVSLAPTHTFHVGFWFNNPADAAPCGFDVTKPTPFNGDHNAGPNAAISVPNATTGLGPLSIEANPNGLQYFPLSAPVRLLDTRGQHAFKNLPTLTAKQTVNLPGRFSFDGVTVPASAQALVGNATVDNSQSPVPAGYATLFPGGQTAPTASNLNFVPGTVRPNQFTVGLGADGTFNLLSSTGGNFILDITGYYAPPSAGGLFFHPLTAPIRLLDTRPGQTAFKTPGVPLTAGQTLNLPGQFTLNGITIPNTAKALAGNATVDNSTNAPAGFATIFPGGSNLPPTSNLNFVPATASTPATVAPNAFTVGLGGDGSFNLFSSSGGNFILDITGFYDTVATGGLNFFPLDTPVRELDTRAGQTALVKPGAPLTAGGTVTLPGPFIFNDISVPGKAKALVGNATVDNSINAPAGFATLFPGGATRPLASNLNYGPGTVAPNAFIVGIGSDGTYVLFSLSGSNFIIDVSGYFAAPTT